MQRAEWLSTVLEGKGSCEHRISGGATQGQLQRAPQMGLGGHLQTLASLDQSCGEEAKGPSLQSWQMLVQDMFLDKYLL